MLDAETKRRIGVLGAAGLSSFAQRSYVLSPPTRLGGEAALFHGLTPTAKCGRRIRGLLEPRAGARGIKYSFPSEHG